MDVQGSREELAGWLVTCRVPLCQHIAILSSIAMTQVIWAWPCFCTLVRVSSHHSALRLRLLDIFITAVVTLSF